MSDMPNPVCLGRRVSRSAHRMEGEVYVGRPLPAVAVFDATLKKARKRDSAAIEMFKAQCIYMNDAADDPMAREAA